MKVYDIKTQEQEQSHYRRRYLKTTLQLSPRCVILTALFPLAGVSEGRAVNAHTPALTPSPTEADHTSPLTVAPA